MDRGRFSSRMNWLYAASKMMMDLFSFAKSTSAFSCSLVATAPVGLFGEQKKMTPASLAFPREGKNPLSGVHGRYAMPLNWDVFELSGPVCPIMTLLSTKTG